MTSKLFRAFSASSALIALGLAAQTAQAATASANANANILEVITLSNTAPLEFATIVPAGSADTVAVSAAGVRTCGAALTCSGTATAAAFTIPTGTTGQTVAIVSANSATLTSGANNMNITGIAPSAATLVLTAGLDAFTVGGTLNVGANQAAGLYTGSFNVTVNYQ